MNYEAYLPFLTSNDTLWECLWQVLDRTKDENVDFLLDVAMHLDSDGADRSMGGCARYLGANFRGGRAHNSPACACAGPE